MGDDNDDNDNDDEDDDDDGDNNDDDDDDDNGGRDRLRSTRLPATNTTNGARVSLSLPLFFLLSVISLAFPLAITAFPRHREVG